MENKQFPYSAINVKVDTKLRATELYYKLKISKGFKSFDEFINYVLDNYKKE
jgi:hypothetical protein